MWSSENERLGFKRCTPLGYFLVSLAFLMFVTAAVALVAVCFLVVSRGLAARLSLDLLYFFLAPGCLGLAGWICHRVAWFLAQRKQFVYDYQSDKCHWNDA